jgi:hypothetical protein
MGQFTTLGRDALRELNLIHIYWPKADCGPKPAYIPFIHTPGRAALTHLLNEAIPLATGKGSICHTNFA